MSPGASVHSCAGALWLTVQKCRLCTGIGRGRVQRSFLQRRQFAPSAGPFRRMCHFQDDREFRDLFRFRRPEFYDLLKELRLVSVDGKLLNVKVGRNVAMGTDGPCPPTGV